MEGILLIDKPKGKTSFFLVHLLRKLTSVKKIGHTGTLDPMATGLMVMLIGKNYTRLSDQFLSQNKSYEAQITFGYATDTYDAEGKTTHESPHIPTLAEVEEILTQFQGTLSQTPPQFSAKKVNGVKGYEAARKGQTIELKPVQVTLNTTLLSYSYPHLHLKIDCSKGTYIRSIAHDLGLKLTCFATLTALKRTQSGTFHLSDCVNGTELMNGHIPLETLHNHLKLVV